MKLRLLLVGMLFISNLLNVVEVYANEANLNIEQDGAEVTPSLENEKIGEQDNNEEVDQTKGSSDSNQLSVLPSEAEVESYDSNLSVDNSEEGNRFSDDSTKAVEVGVFGTVSWTFENGILSYISAGTLGVPASFRPRPKTGEVKKIVFTQPVKAGAVTKELFNYRYLEIIEGLELVDFSATTNYSAMFSGATQLYSADFSSLNTPRSLSYINNMFEDVASLETLILPQNINLVNNTKYADGMFSGMSSLKHIDISGLPLSSNMKLTSLFLNAGVGNRPPESIILGAGQNFNQKIGLRLIPTINTIYTGRWIGLATGKTYESSDILGLTYDGTNPDTYIWEIATGIILVKYVDEEGNELSDSITLTGLAGSKYETEAREITGWEIKEIQGTTSGEFAKNPQEVTYVYERKEAAPVEIKYQDEEGSEIATKEVLSGKVGLPYEAKAKEITGWSLKEVPLNEKGIFLEEPQEVIYVYERKEAAPVEVKYQDEEGNEIATKEVLSGKVGLPYEAKAKEIAGWSLKEVPLNEKGIFLEEPQEVIYVYERKEAAPIEVKYQDEEGNEIATKEVLSGKVGLPYEAKAKEIAGWSLKEVPLNEKGIFLEESQEVIYVYTKIEGNEINSSTDSKVGSNSNQNRLPKAGETNKKPKLVSIVGLLLLSLLLMMGVKNRNNVFLK
ncbi:hypothetical protein IGJ02_000210 [Enterococcus sp. DIV0724b]|uniref:MucBP domain-containing protein n=1 Tax=Enterococcus sp. DIV0724b TaxID=2774694 RepID=UPI003D2FC976